MTANAPNRNLEQQQGARPDMEIPAAALGNTLVNAPINLLRAAISGTTGMNDAALDLILPRVDMAGILPERITVSNDNQRMEIRNADGSSSVAFSNQIRQNYDSNGRMTSMSWPSFGDTLSVRFNYENNRAQQPSSITYREPLGQEQTVNVNVRQAGGDISNPVTINQRTGTVDITALQPNFDVVVQGNFQPADNRYNFTTAGRDDMQTCRYNPRTYTTSIETNELLPPNGAAPQIRSGEFERRPDGYVRFSMQGQVHYERFAAPGGAVRYTDANGQTTALEGARDVCYATVGVNGIRQACVNMPNGDVYLVNGISSPVTRENPTGTPLPGQASYNATSVRRAGQKK